MIKLKRIYEEAEDTDGYRVLVDRLWPRGIKKTDAALDSWLKEIAPSTDLRKWYAHDPEKFPDFKEKYLAELAQRPASEAVDELRNIIQKHDIVTLIYSAKTQTKNQAVVLKEYLDSELMKK
ncbi:DUF488 domain-containing protein [Enterococcus mediterraneensis]|uniref:DUF488 domain-containing protein n=1 Tax=Enterococcus mediterraneensis TaxID=2364791 RepID=UPI000F052575|nr:DUF488 domain-containing protein [Enterococcus mediterraneensis]